MPSISVGDVAARLKAAEDSLPVRTANRITQHLARARAQLAYLLTGTAHPLALEARAALDRCTEAITVLVGQLTRAQSHLAAYRAQITGSSGSSAAPPAVKVSTPTSGGWRRTEDVPEFVREVGRCLLARPVETNRPTTGFFEGEFIESGGRDRVIADDLDHAGLRAPPVTLYQHVESKVAARLRRETDGRQQDRHLVVDNTVCGSNSWDRDHSWSCEAILPSILPAGSRLHVWVTRDAGRTWWHTAYAGTGERIRP